MLKYLSICLLCIFSICSHAKLLTCDTVDNDNKVEGLFFAAQFDVSLKKQIYSTTADRIFKASITGWQYNEPETFDEIFRLATFTETPTEYIVESRYHRGVYVAEFRATISKLDLRGSFKVGHSFGDRILDTSDLNTVQVSCHWQHYQKHLGPSSNEQSAPMVLSQAFHYFENNQFQFAIDNMPSFTTKHDENLNVYILEDGTESITCSLEKRLSANSAQCMLILNNNYIESISHGSFLANTLFHIISEYAKSHGRQFFVNSRIARDWVNTDQEPYLFYYFTDLGGTIVTINDDDKFRIECALEDQGARCNFN